MSTESLKANGDLEWPPFVPPSSQKNSAITKAAIAALSIFVSTLVISTVCVSIFNPVALASTAIIVTACFVSVAAGSVIGYALKSLKNLLEDDDFSFTRPDFEAPEEVEETFSLDASCGTPEEISAVSKGLTNPSCNCFMNAMLQNIFSLEDVGAFILEKLQEISQNEELGDVNPFDEEPYVTVKKPVGMSSEDFIAFEATLKAKKDQLIEKNEFKIKEYVSLPLDLVLDEHITDSKKIAEFYKSLCLKDAASFSLAIINKWRSKESISAKEATLLRLSLVKLMNRKLTCELKEVIPVVSAAKKALGTKQDNSALSYKVKFGKKNKTTSLGKITAQKRLKAIAAKTLTQQKKDLKAKPLKPQKVAALEWQVPGFDKEMKISTSSQECPSEFYNMLISSIQELTHSVSPSIIQVNRRYSAFRVSDDPAATPLFSEALKIDGADKDLVENQGMLIKDITGHGTEVDLTSLVLSSLDLNGLDRIEDTDYFSQDQAALKAQHPKVSSRMSYAVTLPDNLLMQTKHTFYNAENDALVKAKHIRFKFTDQEALQITVPSSPLVATAKTYKLRSFVVHEGKSAQSGHYVNYMKVDRTDGTSYWIKQNDSTSSPISFDEVKYLFSGKSSSKAPCALAFKAE